MGIQCGNQGPESYSRVSTVIRSTNEVAVKRLGLPQWSKEAWFISKFYTLHMHGAHLHRAEKTETQLLNNHKASAGRQAVLMYFRN